MTILKLERVSPFEHFFRGRFPWQPIKPVAQFGLLPWQHDASKSRELLGDGHDLERIAEMRWADDGGAP